MSQDSPEYFPYDFYHSLISQLMIQLLLLVLLLFSYTHLENSKDDYEKIVEEIINFDN